DAVVAPAGGDGVLVAARDRGVFQRDGVVVGVDRQPVGVTRLRGGLGAVEGGGAQQRGRDPGRDPAADDQTRARRRFLVTGAPSRLVGGVAALLQRRSG